jgi:hypothetical protein
VTTDEDFSEFDNGGGGGSLLACIGLTEGDELIRC